MKRGEVWWASLRAPRGSEPGYRRPVLVVQSDVFTSTRIKTVVVAIITSNLRLAEAPGNVKLSPRQSGLRKPSVVNVSQLISIDRRVLTERVSSLTPPALAHVDRGLRLVLSV